MNERFGDIFKVKTEALCITTNGYRKKATGESVMGRGTAARAKELYPWLPFRLGKMVERFGNRTMVVVGEFAWHDLPLVETPFHNNLVSFPVKDESEIVEPGKANLVEHARSNYSVGSLAPGFHCKARPEIIERSAIELVEIANRHRWTHVTISRPGCGAGGLTWDVVKPILEKHLDSRFYVYDVRY